MSSSPEATADSTFICDCTDWARTACKGEPFYGRHEGKRYCVLHFPGTEKSADFKKAIKRKLDQKDFNFRGTWFPDERSFKEFHFTQKADFSYAVFSAGADFDAIFDAEVDFTYAVFVGEAYFRYAIFESQVKLRSATFKYHVRFGGGRLGAQASLNLQYARIERAEQVSFNTITLRPHWFVNVNSSKFDFANVTWDWRSIDEEVESLERNDIPGEEVESPEPKDIRSPHKRLAIACRHLAVNAEENHRYEEASKFRYMAMDAQRFENGHGFTPWRLSWWYWLVSGYGERILRAFVMLIGVWLLFALLYTQVGFARWEPNRSNEREAMTEAGDEVGAPLSWSRALMYSLGVMTLQKAEPRPATTTAQLVVILETFLGPLQVALLALAVRRKFMR
jgi:hypothetical protein